MSAVKSGSGRFIHSQPSLLLVEYDQALRQALPWEFAERGCLVHTAATCREARTAAAMQAFD